MASAWATLIVYGLQMILSYFLGQKHFPIPYNLKKFFLYLGSSLVLFWIGSQVHFEKSILNHFIHNLLVVFFLLFVFSLEKNNLKSSKTH
jgi:hypothetical protein